VNDFPLYRKISDGSLWRHTWTFAACQYPIELTPDGGGYHIHITRAELYDEYEKVWQREIAQQQEGV